MKKGKHGKRNRAANNTKERHFKIKLGDRFIASPKESIVEASLPNGETREVLLVHVGTRKNEMGTDLLDFKMYDPKTLRLIDPKTGLLEDEIYSPVVEGASRH